MAQKAAPLNLFSPEHIAELTYQTPYFLVSRQDLIDRYHEFLRLFPDASIQYAVKANPHPSILRVLRDAGCGFEIASTFELNDLKELEVDPKKIIFGTAVKSTEQIAEAWGYGLDRFAFDSVQELDRIAAAAPGARVYARAIVDDTGSVFTMSEKFGAPLNEVASLLKAARIRGLHPYGVSFNVGSQARHAQLWRSAIESLGPVLEELAKEHITLDVINIGGGYPGTNYANSSSSPTIESIARQVQLGRNTLPYQPALIMEPGRAIVADSAVLLTSVLARIKRGKRTWLYLDAGAYNALFEGMMFQGDTKYEVELSRHSRSPKAHYVLAGPTGDGLDVVSNDASLPGDIQPGDKLLFRSVGAYSLSLASSFNGFPPPATYLV